MTQGMSDSIRNFVLDNFLEGEDRDLLKDDTPLVSSGVINSLSLIKLVAFLEGEFRVKIKPHEMNADHLDTIQQMAEFIGQRRAAG